MAKKRVTATRSAKKKTTKKVDKRTPKQRPAKKQKAKRGKMSRTSTAPCSSHCCVVGDVNGYYAWLDTCPSECTCPIADMVGNPVPMSGIVCSAVCGDKKTRPQLLNVSWSEVLQILSKHYGERIDAVCVRP